MSSGDMPVPGRRAALSSLVEGLGPTSSPTVLARHQGAWGAPRAFGAEVRGLAAALSGYGLAAGSHAAVLGAEGYDTLLAGLAVIVSGGTLVPLDPSMPDDAMRRALAASGTVQAIASDERQLARILALRPDLPALELVLLGSAQPSERKPAAMLVAAAIQVGTTALAEEPELLRRSFAEGENGVACVVVEARGELRPIQRAAVLALSEAIGDAMSVRPGQTVLAALPVGSVERLACAIAVTGHGASLLVPDPVERPDSGLDLQSPDAILLDVSGLGRLHRAWIEDIESRPWFKRVVTRWALRQGRGPERTGWKHRVADRLALRGLRALVGGRVSILHVLATTRGGASSEVDTFFHAVGLTVRYLSPDSGPKLAR